MSFNGQSNQWQRSVPSFPAGQQMFLQQPFAQQHFSGGGSSYPLNPVAFQQPAAESSNQPQHYNSIGTVTKVNSECGLVNDEVFFYRNSCKGQVPKLGDRVLFEASFSTGGQFKWNATRVQLMPPQQSHPPQPLMGGAGSSSSNVKGYFNSVAPLSDYQRGAQAPPQQRHSSPARRFSPVRDRERDRERYAARGGEQRRERNYRSRDRDEDDHVRKRRRVDVSRERVASNNSSSRANIRSDRERERERERERDREREREREKESTRIDRSERSPHRSAAAKGRKLRAIRRYMVQIPKNVLAYKHADVQELRRRYNTLYIPSDFFRVNAKWSTIFTPDNPFSLHRACQFHIMHKIVESPLEQQQDTIDALEPSDADYTYSAKVMLMACPPLTELYQKCFEDDDGDSGDQHSANTAVHPSRLIGFLVGTRGRNEPMAIGGPWSPSLDGGAPDKDPGTLIRTAIRTCKALTGIDLSNCTQWYRFMELHYYRNEQSSSGAKDKGATSTAAEATTATAPRIETVVFYLPDIHACLPSVPDWQDRTQLYKASVESVIARKCAAASAAAAKPPAAAAPTTTTTTSQTGDEDGNAADTVNDELNKSTAAMLDTGDGATTDITETAECNDATAVNADADADADGEEGADEAVAGDDSIDDGDSALGADAAAGRQQHEKVASDSGAQAPAHAKGAPTHYAQLELKTMKVHEIRGELDSRQLSTKGARNILLARLAKAINVEKAADTEPSHKRTHSDAATAKSESKETAEPAAEENRDAQSDQQRNAAEAEDEAEDWADVVDVDMNDIVILDEYDASKNPDSNEEIDEKEKAQLLRRYTLPGAPHILVHPHRTAKGGKFDCSVMSLSVLLDYRPEDTKERFFEVSLFAELFNEMLMRDFGFNIYKELLLYGADHSNGGSGNTHAADTNESAASEPDASVGHKASASAVVERKDDGQTTGVVEDAAESKSNATDTTSEKSMRREREREPEDDSQSNKSQNDRKRKLPSASGGGGGGGGGSGGKEKAQSDGGAERRMLVAKPQLLLSFVYFDTTHCGYVFEKDLEELFHILDLKLSRGQIRKLLGKLGTRQAFYYRKLTDREESLDGAAVAALDDNVETVSVDELKGIALGNAQYTRIFDDARNGDEQRDGASTHEGLVNHNGIMIHVGKLLEQNKRVEKTYWDLEKLHNELRKQHTDLQKDHSKSVAKVKDLQSEARSLGRKLTDANQEVLSLGRKCREQTATLSSIYGRVAPYFNREKEGRDHKSENSSSGRDTEKDKEKNKDKDKDRDNECKEKDKCARDVAKTEKVKKERSDKEKDIASGAETKSQNDKVEQNSGSSPGAADELGPADDSLAVEPPANNQ